MKRMTKKQAENLLREFFLALDDEVLNNIYANQGISEKSLELLKKAEELDIGKSLALVQNEDYSY